MDMSTRYLGLALKNPLVASASPLNAELDNVRRFEDAGAAAVVLPSLFEEQIEYEEQLLESLVATGTDSFAEAQGYFPAHVEYKVGPHRYLELVRRASEAVEIPVVASLNGVTDHGWTDHARLIEEAGAAAIELNVYFIPADLGVSGRDVEQRHLDILSAVKGAVSIPVAVKLNPYFSALGHMAAALDAAGADGLVLFNRFYQPDIDLARLKPLANLKLSSAEEIRLPLMWIGILSGRIKASLAASTGVQETDEVIKYLLAGADVVMSTSAMLRHGIGHMRTLVAGLAEWLGAREVATLDQVRGRMSRRHTEDPTGFERGSYIRMLQGYKA